MENNFEISKQDVKEFLMDTFSASWDGKFYDIHKKENGRYVLSEPKDYCGISIDSRIGTVLKVQKGFEPMGVCVGKAMGNVYLKDADGKGLYHLVVDGQSTFLLTPLDEQALHYYTLPRHFKYIGASQDAIIRDFEKANLCQDYSLTWQLFLSKKYPDLCPDFILGRQSKISKLNNRIVNLLAEVEDLKQMVSTEEENIRYFKSIMKENELNNF